MQLSGNTNFPQQTVSQSAKWTERTKGQELSHLLAGVAIGLQAWGLIMGAQIRVYFLRLKYTKMQ